MAQIGAARFKQSANEAAKRLAVKLKDRKNQQRLLFELIIQTVGIALKAAITTKNVLTL